MNELLSRLLRVCITLNHEEPNGGLMPGVDEALLERIEHRIGASLPVDVRTAYLAFNGMSRKHIRLFPENFSWLPLQENGLVMRTWDGMLAAEQALRADTDMWEDQSRSDEYVDSEGGAVYHSIADSKRILIAASVTEVGMYVDLRPAKRGRLGQLIRLDPQDPEATSLMSPSFGTAIDRIVSAFESGSIYYDSNADANWHYSESKKPVSLDDLTGARDPI